MGLFNIFSRKQKCKEVIFRKGALLVEETSRVYRNHLEGVSPTGVGLYKARLLSCSFSLASFVLTGWSKYENESAAYAQQLNSLALGTLSDPNALPYISREAAIEASGDHLVFYVYTIKKIFSTFAADPTRFGPELNEFKVLMSAYIVALSDSIQNDLIFEEQYAEKLLLPVQSLIHTHFRYLFDMMENFSK